MTETLIGLAAFHLVVMVVVYPISEPLFMFGYNGSSILRLILAIVGYTCGNWGWVLMLSLLVTAVCLLLRRCYFLCCAMSFVHCAFLPLGTILGVTTLICLMKTRSLFRRARTPVSCKENKDAIP